MAVRGLPNNQEAEQALLSTMFLSKYALDKAVDSLQEDDFFYNNNKIIFNTLVDLSKKNEADEWDIINLNNHFVITKTIGSFFTNKVWAWIDRGHTIWKEEIYDSQKEYTSTL